MNRLVQADLEGQTGKSSALRRWRGLELAELVLDFQHVHRQQVPRFFVEVANRNRVGILPSDTTLLQASRFKLVRRELMDEAAFSWL